METLPNVPVEANRKTGGRTAPSCYYLNETQGRWRMVLMKVREWGTTIFSGHPVYTPAEEGNIHREDLFRWFHGLEPTLTAAGCSFGVERIVYQDGGRFALTAFHRERAPLLKIRETWLPTLSGMQEIFSGRQRGGERMQVRRMDFPAKYKAGVEQFFSHKVVLSRYFPDFAHFHSQVRGPYFYTRFVPEGWVSCDIIPEPWHYTSCGQRVVLHCSNHYDAVLARLMDEPDGPSRD
jgi:hypothetical protein